MSGPGMQAIHISGGLVPPGLFGRVRAGDVRAPESLAPASYHLPGRETVRDAANRSWTYLRGAWQGWREHAAVGPRGAAGNGAARERWLLVLMRELGYGQLQALRGGIDIDGVEYPISHAWQHVPVHLLGPGVDLDRRNAGVAGAARAPQSMIQELLNRSEAHLWALLSNGLRLRLLRDSTALAGSAYVEFDLEAIFDGELFAEFLLLWQLCHVSRLEKFAGADAPANCWLEAWRGEAVEGGTRALDQLRDGVERALTELGSGFIAHPDNVWLREALSSGALSTAAYHHAVLRLVYRLLFLSVAEDRGVLLHDASPEAADRYARYFSVGRLRRLSRVRAGGPHGDLWQSLIVVLGALGGEGLPALGLPVLAGLFDPDDRPLDGAAGPPTDLLAGCALANSALLPAMRHLGWIQGRAERVQPVDYRNLGAEELGSVYESLLELEPRLDLAGHTFTLENVAGNERKTTGSYYTPAALVNALLDSALKPVLDDAVKDAVDNADAVHRLLALTVCDPSCGSGHFLVAAARRIARRVAQLRSGDEEPTPAEVRHALREVVGSCLYGVDVNPFAAELAKVSLWMEALEPGKPLGFLDSRIRVGNSLLGATPALIANGVPDDAFKELAGDDKDIATATRRLNKREREGQHGLYETEFVPHNATLAERRAELVTLADGPGDVRSQARAWQGYDSDDPILTAQRAQADAWCAAFMWKLVPDGSPAPTTAVLRGFASDPESQPAAIRAEVEMLASKYRFFHWHLEFPEVFTVGACRPGQHSQEGWAGGFDCLLGNPPWDHVELKEKEFFAREAPSITEATGARRKQLIQALRNSDPELFRKYTRAKFSFDRTRHFVLSSGRFPLTGRGRPKTDPLFGELFAALTSTHGTSGLITRTEVASDNTSQYFFREIVRSQRLGSLYDFQNRTKFFRGIDSRTSFCLLTLAGSSRFSRPSFAFYLDDPNDVGVHSYTFSREEIDLLNPDTGAAPIFRDPRDAELSVRAAKTHPPLRRQGKSGSYGLTIRRIFNMGLEDVSASILETNSPPAGYLKMLESKLMHSYDHRYGTYDTSGAAAKPRYVLNDEKLAPKFEVNGRHAVKAGLLEHRLAKLWEQDWLLAWGDVARNSDERTMIASILPRAASDFTLRVGFPYDPSDAALLLAIFNSMHFDYLLRMRLLGLHVSDYILEQVPVPEREYFSRPAAWNSVELLRHWLVVRVVELTYTSSALLPFARALGDSGQPFIWNLDRRARLRAEIDAAIFHIYSVSRQELEHVSETFPIAKRKEQSRYNEYQSKRLALEAYDRMADAVLTGEPYQTIVDPPPGQGERHTTRETVAKRRLIE